MCKYWILCTALIELSFEVCSAKFGMLCSTIFVQILKSGSPLHLQSWVRGPSENSHGLPGRKHLTQHISTRWRVTGRFPVETLSLAIVTLVYITWWICLWWQTSISYVCRWHRLSPWLMYPPLKTSKAWLHGSIPSPMSMKLDGVARILQGNQLRHRKYDIYVCTASEGPTYLCSHHKEDMMRIFPATIWRYSPQPECHSNLQVARRTTIEAAGRVLMEDMRTRQSGYCVVPAKENGLKDHIRFSVSCQLNCEPYSCIKTKPMSFHLH